LKPGELINLKVVVVKAMLFTLLLERIGERRLNSTIYNQLIPTFTLKRAGTCLDSCAVEENFSSCI
jgi:hypothetical protein